MDKTMTQDQRLSFLVEAFKADSGDYQLSAGTVLFDNFFSLPNTAADGPIPSSDLQSSRPLMPRRIHGGRLSKRTVPVDRFDP